MMTKKNSLLVVLIVNFSLIMGCNTLGINSTDFLHEKELVVSSEEDPLSNLLQEYVDVLQKDGKVLEKIYLSVKNQFEQDESYQNHFRYILLLTLPNTTFSDPANALTMLKNWSEEDQLPASWQSFRKILIMWLEQEARLKHQAESLKHQLTQERMNAETLQKKIDDIKHMEKSLIRRNLN